MCTELQEVQAALASIAGAFDPSLVSPAQAGEIARVCARIEASATALKGLAAARSAQGSQWKEEGFRSPAEQLARNAGMSPSTARRALTGGRRLSEQRTVAAAALAGNLSGEQAAVVAEGAEADPSKADQLVEMAQRRSLPELCEEVSRIKAAAVDEDSRRRARHRRRSLRSWVDRDGAAHAHLFGHPEDAMQIWQVLDPLRRRLNALRRETSGDGQPSKDQRDSIEGLDYDSLMLIVRVALGATDGELAFGDLMDLGLFPQLKVRAARSQGRSPTDSALPVGDETPDPQPQGRLDGDTTATPATLDVSSDPLRAANQHPALRRGKGAATTDRSGRRRLVGQPMKVFIRVDLSALVRGRAMDGELSEIDGYGPVPVSVIKELLASQNPFIVGVLTKAQRVMGIYHHGRKLTAHQRSAVEFLQAECAVEGCSAHRGLEYDHRDDWARTRYTLADAIDRLCPHHHALKTRDNWALIGTGPKRPFVPPSDPRHPRHRPPSDRSPCPPPHR